MNNYIEACSRLKHDYEIAFATAESRAKYCPIKTCHVLTFTNGIATERLTDLPAMTLNGHSGRKEIYVNDTNGGYGERVYIDIYGVPRCFTNEGITTFRCGAMTCLAIDIVNSQKHINIQKAGFIGNGRTNQMNCRFMKEVFGIHSAVIRGSAKNLSKNIDKFRQIMPDVTVDETDDFALLNECDVVVVCTSNYEREYLISDKLLHKPQIIICLDCGYLLDESFRCSMVSLTDYVEQIEGNYDEEFPFDNKHHKLIQMNEYNDTGKRVCVYLHGIGFADLTIAEMMAKGELYVR